MSRQERRRQQQVQAATRGRQAPPPETRFVITDEMLQRAGIDRDYMDEGMRELVGHIVASRTAQPRRPMQDIIMEHVESKTSPYIERALQLQSQLEVLAQQYTEGRAAHPPRERRHAPDLISRPVLIAIIVVIVVVLLIIAGLALRGLFAGGSSSSPASASTATDVAPALGADGITQTGVFSRSITLVGDMQVSMGVANGPLLLAKASELKAGDFSTPDGTKLGTITDDGGKKVITFETGVSITVRLIKVAPDAAPVTFHVNDGWGRDTDFSLLAQNTDGKFHLTVDGKDFGTWAPPEPVDIGTARIETKDDGDGILLIFPAKAAEKAPEQPTAAPAETPTATQ